MNGVGKHRRVWGVALTLGLFVVAVILVLQHDPENRAGRADDTPDRAELDAARAGLDGESPDGESPDGEPPDGEPPDGGTAASPGLPIARIRVVDALTSRPVASARVEIAEVQVSDNTIRGTTNAQGELRIEIPRPAGYIVWGVAPGYPRQYGYVRLPGRGEIRLRPGARLILDIPPGLRDSLPRVRVGERVNGIQRVFDLPSTRDAIEAGDWLRGIVELHADGGPLHGRSLGRVAMPERGVVRYTLPPLEGIASRVLAIHDRAGQPVPEPRVRRLEDRSVLRRWEPVSMKRTARPGEWRVPLPQLDSVSLSIDARGYARRFIRFPNRGTVKELVSATLEQGTTLIVEAGAEEAIRELTVHYLADEGGGGDAVAFPLRRGGEHGPHQIDVGVAAAEPEAASLLARLPEDLQLPVRIDHMPSKARLLLRATSTDGRTTQTVLSTGAEGSSRSATLRWKKSKTARFRVIGETVAGTRVLLRSKPEVRPRDSFDLLGSTRVDQDGLVTVSGIPDGMEFRVEFKQGWRAAEYRFSGREFTEGSKPIEVRLEGRKMRRLRAQVLNRDETPAAGVFVFFNVPDGVSAGGVTDEQGVASAEVPAGVDIFVGASLRDRHVQARRFPVDRDEVVLPMDPSPARLRIELQVGGTIRQLPLVLRRDGVPVFHGEVSVVGRGFVVVRNLKGGPYQLTVGTGETKQETSIGLADGENRLVTVRVGP